MIDKIVAILLLGISIAAQGTAIITPGTKGIYADQANLPEFVVLDGNIDSNVIEAFEQKWSILPENVKGSFDSRDWKIIITDGNVGGMFYNDIAMSIYGQYVEPAAVTDCDYQKIYYSNNAINMDASMIHEIGHYIDSQFNYPSESAEFARIFSKERYNMLDLDERGSMAHYTTYPQEYFAEAVQQAIEHPEICRETIPQTYEFVMQYINALQ